MDEQKPDKIMQGWEKLLHPQTLRNNLVLASLYLAAYEILRSSVVERIQSFFTYGFAKGDDEPVIDEQYDEVKQLHRSTLLASCLWLQQNGAISPNDVVQIDAIRQHRNRIAHELPKFLSDVDHKINLEHLTDIQRLLRKIETWWIRNVDLAINPEFDDVEVADEDIHPGSVLILNEIISIALDGASNE